MKPFFRTLAIGILSVIFLMQVSLAKVADQRILSLTEIFPNSSYDTFISKYNLNDNDVLILLDDNVTRILSYLRSISDSDNQFFSLIDAIHNKYAVKTWKTNHTSVEKLIDEAFPDGHTASSASTTLDISANRTSPSLDQWVTISLAQDKDYRGWVDFYVQYRGSSSDSRSKVSSSSYFTANDYFEDGVKFTTADGGVIDLNNFIRFHKSGYFRLYVEDAEGNYDYVQFSVETSQSNDELTMSTNRKTPSLNQRVNITISLDDDYRGDLEFYVSHRTSSSSSRGRVSSTSYFTAHDYFEDGYSVVAADGGHITLSSFIRFNRSGYYRVYVQDEDNNAAYIEFDVDGNSNSGNDNSGNSTDTSSSVRSEYTYTATNCKVYTIQYLDSGIYTSSTFINKQYFAKPAYIERYIDSKNPGDCLMRTSYNTNQTFPNNSDSQYIAPNGKIYYIEKEGSSYYSPQMGTKKLFSNLTELRNHLGKANPLAGLWTHTKIESEEQYTAKVTYYKDITLYKTDQGWMSYTTPVGKYFSTAQELKNYLGS